jgi:hypothetical protein
LPFKIVELDNSPKKAEKTLNKTLDKLSDAHENGILLNDVKIVQVFSKLWAFIQYTLAQSNEESAEEMQREIEFGRKKGLC